tara:strand:- start:265 stop:507 length:243 start_codon:yes stop_codon:yes gene_type:complete
MCLFRRQETQGAPAVNPRADQDTELPEARSTTDEGETTAVKYGSSSKKDTGKSANKTGTDALTINLNKDQKGSESGGLNV